MTAEELLNNLTPERQMQVLRSAYIQAIMREERLSAAEACDTIARVAGSSSPSPISGPVDGYPKRGNHQSESERGNS
jgi:hypothetical protein